MYVSGVCKSTRLPTACGIVILVYLARLLYNAQIDLHPTNWKRIFIGLSRVASKVWTEKSLPSSEYCQFVGTTVDDLNKLERQVLDLIMFDLYVEGSEYSEYQTNLQSVVEKRKHSTSR